MRRHTFQPSMSVRQVKQNSQPAGSVVDISHLDSKSQENKPLENMVHQTFLRPEVRQQVSKHSSEENERQETKHTVAIPVLSPKYSFIRPTSDPVPPPDQNFKPQEATTKLSTVRSPEPKKIQEKLPQETRSNQETAHPAETRVLGHPPAELKSQKQKIEPHEVKPQGAIPMKLPDQRDALDSDEKMNNGNLSLPVKSKKKPTIGSHFAFLKGALAKQVKTEELSQDDVIIAVMGPTGSGKSTFIKHATGFDTVVGHTLESCTSEIKIVKLSVPELADGDVVFVDTPGFDDTNKSDADILKMVADWLKSTYEKEILLSGLLYFHRISDNRMAGTPLKNLRMFEELCGKNAFHNVILTTTMWDEVDEETGSVREEQLKSIYWRSMLDRNSTTSRFLGTRESALRLIEPLIDAANEKSSLLLQQEMVDLRSKLPETSAGARLFSETELLVKERQIVLERMRMAMKHSSQDKTSLPALQEEYQKVKTQLDTTLNEMRKLRPGLTLGKRLTQTTRKWFSFKFGF